MTARMVLVTPEALEAAAMLASTDAYRPNLNGAHVAADGTVTATDGHRMIQVAPSAPMPAEDYPSTVVPEGMHAPEAAGVIVPRKAVLEAAKAARKVKHLAIPGLRAVAVSVNETRGQLASTDLDNTSRAEFVPCDGPYPNVAQVYPTDEAVFSAEFNADLLAETLAAFAKVHMGKAQPTVRLTFYGPLRAALVENTDGTARGLCMPTRSEVPGK